MIRNGKKQEIENEQKETKMIIDDSLHIECKRCKKNIPACQEYCRECEEKIKIEKCQLKQSL